MSPLDEAWWAGRVHRQSAVPCDVKAVYLKAVIPSGCQVAEVIGDDGGHYWVKVMGNGHGNQALVTEHVVAGVGALLDACTCAAKVIDFPAAFLSSLRITTGGARPGPAHASVSIGGALECPSEDVEYATADDFQFRGDDGNRYREAQMHAIWDPFLGEDEQWAYDLQDENRLWSYDHSVWLARRSGDWSARTLRDNVDEPWPLGDGYDGLDPEARARCAQSLRDLRPEQILEVLNQTPEEWGTTDADMEVLGWFVYKRSRSVAGRLMAIPQGTKP